MAELLVTPTRMDIPKQMEAPTKRDPMLLRKSIIKLVGMNSICESGTIILQYYMSHYLLEAMNNPNATSWLVDVSIVNGIFYLLSRRDTSIQGPRSVVVRGLIELCRSILAMTLLYSLLSRPNTTFIIHRILGFMVGSSTSDQKVISNPDYCFRQDATADFYSLLGH
ncbi:hypothetical protein HD806DRAFT_535470 [Xylariaceae sp. AK1471]|nr:hypothetical protein HD806DRAFT_535470 [Xylariaceae sp. AK1471]